MSWSDWKDKIIEWLETEDLDSDRIVDDRWAVEEKDDGLHAETYRMPFQLIIEPYEEEDENGSSYMSLILHSGFNTSKLKEHEMVYLYRKMLKMNTQSQMTKYCLVSDIEDEPIIRTDLDFASLNKEEFEEALENTLREADSFFSSILPQDELREITGFNWGWDVYRRYSLMKSLLTEVEEGDISIERAKRRLVSKFDFGEDDAMSILGAGVRALMVERIAQGELSSLPETVDKMSGLLHVDKKEAEKNLKAHLKDWLTDLVKEEVMSWEEAISWLMNNLSMEEGEAYKLLQVESETQVESLRDFSSDDSMFR